QPARELSERDRTAGTRRDAGISHGARHEARAVEGNACWFHLELEPDIASPGGRSAEDLQLEGGLGIGVAEEPDRGRVVGPSLAGDSIEAVAPVAIVDEG